MEHCVKMLSDPEDFLSFLPAKTRHIALVGGGGKTTLLYALGCAFSKQGLRVLLYTTTHILRPERFCHTSAECLAFWHTGSPALIGVETDGGKLKIPPECELSAALSACDIAIAEADGAKQMPIKVPAAHEPVIPVLADTVIAVAGLTALGRPLGEVCFRWELLSLSDEMQVNEAILTEILSSERFAAKSVCGREYLVVLNQADAGFPDRCEAGRRIATALWSRGIPAALCSLAPACRALGG